MNNFTAIPWREQFIFRWHDYDICFVLDQYTYLVGNSPRVDVLLHSDTLSWFRANPSSFFSRSVWWRSNKYQFYSLWFDPTGTRIHNLPHSRRARTALHHRCGSYPIYTGIHTSRWIGSTLSVVWLCRNFHFISWWGFFFVHLTDLAVVGKMELVCSLARIEVNTAWFYTNILHRRNREKKLRKSYFNAEKQYFYFWFCNTKHCWTDKACERDSRKAIYLSVTVYMETIMQSIEINSLHNLNERRINIPQ